jgi:hypothetical protein
MSFVYVCVVENENERETSGVAVLTVGDAVEVSSSETDGVTDGVTVFISETDRVIDARVFVVDEERDMLDVVVMEEVGEGVPRDKLFVNESSSVALSEWVLVSRTMEMLGNDTVTLKLLLTVLVMFGVIELMEFVWDIDALHFSDKVELGDSERLASCESDDVGVDFISVAVFVYDAISAVYDADSITELESVGVVLSEYCFENVMVAVPVMVIDLVGFSVNEFDTWEV